MIEIETRYGPFLAPSPEKDLIGRFLSRYGEWARAEVRFVAAALPSRPVRILDLGAFVGTFGIGLSAEHAVETAVFVEANPEIAPALRQNVERNARAKSTVVEAVVTPDGAARIGHASPDNLGSLTFAGEAPQDEGVTVQQTRAVSLAELVASHGPFDLIKMDVEGLEYAILENAGALLAADGTAFWLECNPTESSLDLADLLVSAGLQVHYFAFPSFAPDNHRGDADPIFPFAFESGLWASRGPAPGLPKELADQGCILRPIRDRESLREALWRTPRWGLEAWKGASRDEMIAYAAHLEAEQPYDFFLQSPGGRYFKRAELEQQIYAAHEASQAMRAQMSSEIRALYVVLEDERSRVAALHDRIEGHKAVTAVLEARISAAQQQAAELQARLADTTARLQAVETSAIWRATRPARAFVGRHPGLRSFLGAGLRGVHKMGAGVLRLLRALRR